MMPYILSAVGIVLAFLGVVVLAFTVKKGHVSEDGNTVVITDGDHYSDPEQKLKEVQNANWRNKNLTPLGWGLIAFGTMLQLAALAFAPEKGSEPF